MDGFQSVPENQSHLLKWVSELPQEQQDEFQKQIKDLNLEDANKFFEKINPAKHTPKPLDLAKLKPVEGSRTNDNATTSNRQSWWNTGLEHVAGNKLAVILLAGGQGTRLGSSRPKGCLNVGNLSQKTLFQLQVERIRKVEKLAGGKIKFYIMTSPATDAAIREEFAVNNNFGMDDGQVTIFSQGLLPCFDNEGKIFLKGMGEIAIAPDGNGGLWKALSKHGIVNDMVKSGVESVHMYCVDNVMTKVADPEFVGFCLAQKADCAAKCVQKKVWNESVGLVCTYKGKPQVVEYSEIDDTVAKLADGDLLAFRAANLCNHFFTVDFIKEVTLPQNEAQLVHHIAKKKIPHINDDGKFITPTANNGIKLEKFVFDVFAQSKNFSLFIDERLQEFSPLKNHEDKTATDNARTARSHLHRLHHGWVLAAGGTFENEEANTVPESLDFGDASKNYPFVVEVSPLVSYKGEGLEARCQGKTFSLPLHLE